MASRWKYDRPMSRAAFEARFPDEASCARHLAARRWPDGFVCPACGHDRGWELKRRRASWECAACGKETSVTAGTIMHRSHLPLKTWFMAVHIVTSHSNGISALQLQAQLGLGSYKSAWLLLHKLRRAMVDPDRSLLEDLIEIDEATLPFRTAKDLATGGQGRSPQGKMRIAGAVELSPEGEPRRIRNLPWPAPRPSAPLPRRVRVPLEPPPPHRNGLRHPARHRHAPATRRLPRHRRTTRLIPAGRAPATARPPIRLNRSRIPALQPA